MDDLKELWENWDNPNNPYNQACILGSQANLPTLDYNELEDIMQLLTL